MFVLLRAPGAARFYAVLNLVFCITICAVELVVDEWGPGGLYVDDLPVPSVLGLVCDVL